MLRSWKLGTAFGIGIYVHWTFLLLPVWLLLQNLGGGHLGLAFYLVALTLTVFGCVVLHELGHALMARRFGIATRDITLYPIGGVARLERMSERPWEEFLIALAGPAVNVVIAAGLFVALLLGGMALVPGLGHPGGAVQFLGDLMLANVFLVGFNLLPAFPMDGGRVLRALLALRLGRVRATEIATSLGFVMAVLFAMGAAYFSNLMLLLIGVFVLFAGQQELAAVRYREAMRHREPLDVLPAEPVLQDQPVPVVRPFSGFLWDSRAGRWVEWRNGRPFYSAYLE
jgi:Zn-dependent protease